MSHQEKRTMLGKKLFNLSVKISKSLANNLKLYYLLNYTWGLFMTIVGWIVYWFITIFMHSKIKEKGSFGPCRYIMIGKNWGGLNLGTVFLLGEGMGDMWTLHTKQHECGHSFQNAVLGPLFIFMVLIPSVTRYWVQHFNSKKGVKNRPYDEIWFEGSASTIGYNFYCNNLKEKK